MNMTAVKNPAKIQTVVEGTVVFGERILLLKRTPERRSSPNKWQTISGYIDGDESAEMAVLREVKEETGLNGRITKVGRPFAVVDDWGRWRILPFLISADSDAVSIDSEEHSEFKWVKASDIKEYECVKGIEKDLKAVGLVK